ISGVDQLSGDAQAVPVNPDAALEHIPDAQLLANLPDIDRLGAELEGGCPGNNLQTLHSSQRIDQLIRQSVAKRFVLGVAEILERQDRDRWGENGRPAVPENYPARVNRRARQHQERADQTSPAPATGQRSPG